MFWVTSQAVEELNIKPKYWKDLIDDTLFTRKDIIHLQDPLNLEVGSDAEEGLEWKRRDPRLAVCKERIFQSRAVQLDAEMKLLKSGPCNVWCHQLS